MVQKMDAQSAMDTATAIRASNQQIREVTPEPTMNNSKDFGKGLLQFSATRNSFLETLVNRIGKVLIDTRIYNNPLNGFKKGRLDAGYTIESIYTDLVRAKAFDPQTAETDVFARVKPDVKAYYYDLDRRDMYKQTITQQELSTAFTSWQGVANLANSIINAMVNSNNVDEFEYMKDLMDKAITDGRLKVVKVKKPANEEDATEFLTQVRTYSNLFQYARRDYNPAGVKTWTPRSDQRIMLTALADANVSTKSLAGAFHLGERELQAQEVMIDELHENPNIAGVLFDQNFYMVYDKTNNMESIYNPEGMYWNYFYHVWQLYGASMFTNAVVFMYDDGDITVPDVTGVQIIPVSAIMKIGDVKQFVANVNTTSDSVDKTVTWTLTGQSSETTTVGTDGKVTIGADETATTITLTATSKADATKKRDATITIQK